MMSQNGFGYLVSVIVYQWLNCFAPWMPVFEKITKLHVDRCATGLKIGRHTAGNLCQKGYT